MISEKIPTSVDKFKAISSDNISVQESDDPGDRIVTLNMGPSHPATHGVLRLVLSIDGEVITEVVPHIGYLHTGMEKLGEYMSYHQFIPITDRMDYLAPMLMNLGYILGVEKLLGITDEIPARAQWLRVLYSELMRISSHLIWLGTSAIDLGAMSPIFYALQDREQIMNIFEETCGARLTSTYFRIGGLREDIPDTVIPMIEKFLKDFAIRLDEYQNLVTGNPILINRLKGIGCLSKETALSYCCSGPVLRASGVNYDVRKARPYSGYEKFKFNIPVYQEGDSYARFLVRMDEMRESATIVRQAIDAIPAGPVKIDRTDIILPDKHRTQGNMEELINHFILSCRGFNAPVGEVFSTIESSKGEFGVYLVSTGGEKPYRLRVHSPSFLNLSVLPAISRGSLIADIVAIIGSLDIVLGEIDR
ncbi:MAG: NADH-quinone oxidoreductase subunit D [Candidatus Riflebacteria bacterium]|nr:NADH-quinone oxidoreductase subunit D [Candidatus Riflebacteria bacterium]